VDALAWNRIRYTLIAPVYDAVHREAAGLGGFFSLALLRKPG
jgi:hypothetical protein